MQLNHRARANRRRRRQQKRGLEQALTVALFCAPFLLVVLALGAFTLGLRTAAAVGRDIPRLEDQKAVVLAQTSRIFAADGTLLAYLHGGENRTIVGGERIPQVVKDALVAVEDERFYEHTGVDFEGLARAAVRDLEAGRIVEGASTITMLLVGNLYSDRTDTSFTRKFRDMALAWQLESVMSKDEILDQYLNTVFFGSNAYGIQAAARTFFDKDPKDLTLSEAALLVGLPNAPTAYNPRSNPKAALVRRNVVLARMYSNGFIPYQEYKQAAESPLGLAASSPYTRVQEPYFVAYVRKQLIDMFGEDMVFKGGLTVDTSIEPKYQQMAAEAISSTLDEPGDPSAALVAIETRTGYIRAMVGGTDYDSSKFNLAAQGRRQPGSAFKTFALTAAVEMGVDPYSTYYESMPLELDIPGSREPWRVKTYGGSYYGTSSLVQATLRSDNTVFAQLALDVGVDRIIDIAQRMGITSTLNANPAIVLGGLTYGVSPLEMASAYGTLANQGVHVQPTAILRVKDSQGKVIWEADPKKTQAVSAGVAYVVTRILEQNIQRGTGTRARLDRPAAGKTGTAQEYQDAWFCGFTPQVTTAVWVGHPEAQIEMRNVHGIRVTGGSFPATIWGKFMRQMMQDYEEEDFTRPAQMVDYDHTFTSRYAVEPTTTSSSDSSSTSLAPPLTYPDTSGNTAPPTNPPGTTPATTTPPTISPPTTKPPSTTYPTGPPPTQTPTTALPPTAG
ncbi:MAG: PBP1A family penicillin-binding protein [Thermoleophilia bacterium]|nr:PBP1A family penicillin-binding protein [Thermoleophilia bacterium]